MYLLVKLIIIMLLCTQHILYIWSRKVIINTSTTKKNTSAIIAVFDKKTVDFFPHITVRTSFLHVDHRLIGFRQHLKFRFKIKKYLHKYRGVRMTGEELTKLRLFFFLFSFYLVGYFAQCRLVWAVLWLNMKIDSSCFQLFWRWILYLRLFLVFVWNLEIPASRHTSIPRYEQDSEQIFALRYR